MNRQLQNPKLIELKVFEETQACIGLHNFRFFQEYLGWEKNRCERHEQTFSIAMCDIDNFKDYNDRFGHNQGNSTLQVVARTLVEAGREEDVVSRYGGEEFVIIMPATSKDDAAGVADRVREAVGDLELSADDPTHRVTVSFGVANYPIDATSTDDLIRCADRAMYISKARGKNQVQLYGVEFTLKLPDHGQNVTAHGRVIRADPSGAGKYELAISIVDIDTRQHLVLKRYIRSLETESPGPFEPR